MTSTNLNVSELDFFKIKELLKAKLKNQNEYTDYDFNGAGLSVILDLMAYSQHYTGVHTNLAFAETFLDSAVLRASVVSRAKELGYLPRSKTASKALLRVSFSVDSNPAQYVLPKGTRFSASAGGETYTFVTVKDNIINNDGNDIFTDTIEVYQGKFTTISYTTNLNDASQRYLVASKDADTRFLSILHRDTKDTLVSNQYTFITDLDIGSLSSDTQVYYLTETHDGFFEVYFGDNVIGKANVNGNYIEVTYLITDGSASNGAKTFSLSSSLTGVSSISVITIEPAFGGGERESIESIKYLAPFYYQSQGRAVTNDDYKSLIKSNYPDVDDITVWGGEDNIPPAYGKVFVAIKPKASSFFSNAVKESIKSDIISRFNIMSIRPDIVDPDYIDVKVETVVTYNARLYTGTTNDTLETDITTAIETFFANDANRFGQPLYFSKLVAAIDEVSPLVLNSITNLTLSKSNEIFPGTSAEYTYSYNNSLYEGSIRSNAFLIGGIEYRIRDIPDAAGGTVGTIGVYRTDTGTYLTRNTGTVDYNSGEVVIQNLKIDSIVNDSINKLLTVSVAPGSFTDVNNPELVYTDNNVYTNSRDQIITLAENGINLTLIPDESV